MLPRLGRLKLHESVRRLAHRLDAGTARILSATVRRDGARWHVAFRIDVGRGQCPAHPRTMIGMDVGVMHLAAAAAGKTATVPPQGGTPNHLLSKAS